MARKGGQRQEAVQGQGVGGVKELQSAAELQARPGYHSHLTCTSSFTGVAQKIGEYTEIALQNLVQASGDHCWKFFFPLCLDNHVSGNKGVISQCDDMFFSQAFRWRLEHITMKEFSCWT